MISLCQYILAIFVILLHVQRIFSNDILHFIQKSIFSRMAVPFFMVCTSFFIRAKEVSNQKALDSYLKKSFKTYLGLSLLYLPYASLYFVKLKIPLSSLPLAFCTAILYLGMCYHLWYFPALFFGLKLTDIFSKRYRRKTVLLICLLLYIIGAIETYSAYLKTSPLISFYVLYKNYFLTTRNGLFYAPIFIFLGRIAFDYRNKDLLSASPFAKLLISFALFLMEGSLIYIHQGDDKNFMLSLIPFTLFLFNWVSRTHLFQDKNWYQLKLYSVAYFFFHPIFIEIAFYMIKDFPLKKWERGLYVSLFTLGFTHAIALLYQVIHSQKMTRVVSLPAREPKTE